MNYNVLIGYLAGICILFIFGRLFIVPLKFLLKLFANSLIGAILISIINFIGAYFSFHIGLNAFTIIFVSILGIPGATLLSLVNLLL